jgi:hypothetical protein
MGRLYTACLSSSREGGPLGLRPPCLFPSSFSPSQHRQHLARKAERLELRLKSVPDGVQGTPALLWIICGGSDPAKGTEGSGSLGQVDSVTVPLLQSR